MKIKISYDCDHERDIRQQCVAKAYVPISSEAGVYKNLAGYGSTYQAAKGQLIDQVRLYMQKPKDEEVEIL